jgi:hypothetical protein
VRTIRGAMDRLLLHWEAGLRRLPFFTQRTAVLLLGVLVATLAMLGGVVALVGWPGANGPAHLVPGERAGQAPASRPEPGGGPAPGSSGAGVRSGADAGGATAAPPSPADAARSAPTGGVGADRAATGTSDTTGAQAPGATASRATGPGAAAQGSGATGSGAQGSGGAAGAGAGGPPAAPPTTSPPTTTPQDLLDPVDELLGPVVSTLLP